MLINLANNDKSNTGINGAEIDAARLVFTKYTRASAYSLVPIFHSALDVCVEGEKSGKIF